MLEIKLHVFHEWRPGHADPLARIERIVLAMNDITNRLTASVDNLASALGNQTSAIADVATAIRNHPASTTDNGALAALAERLDGIATSVNSSTADLHQLAGEENAEDAGPTDEPAPVAVEPPADPSPPSDPAPASDGGVADDGTLTQPVTEDPPVAGAADSSVDAGGDAASDAPAGGVDPGASAPDVDTANNE